MFKWNMSSVYTRGGDGEQHGKKRGGGIYNDYKRIFRLKYTIYKSTSDK